MGGRGNGAARNSSFSPQTRENEYGFEVENTNSPELEFNDNLWKKMAELRGYGAFEDSDLRKLVDDKVSDLVEEYGDLERYDADLTNLIEHMSGENVTNDEYWAGYHLAADWLGIKQPRYTVLDESGSAWDEKYSSVEAAEVWANEHSDAKFVYDTWTRKMKKIGGKNWKK